MDATRELFTFVQNEITTIRGITDARDPNHVDTLRNIQKNDEFAKLRSAALTEHAQNYPISGCVSRSQNARSQLISSAIEYLLACTKSESVAAFSGGLPKAVGFIPPGDENLTYELDKRFGVMNSVIVDFGNAIDAMNE